MNRRSFLAGISGAGTIALGGCLGGDEERFTLNVVDYNFREDEDGYLEAWATVSNVGNEKQSGTLYIHGDLNGESLVRVRDVSLEAHETRDYTVTYDVKMDDVRSYSLDVEIEPRDS